MEFASFLHNPWAYPSKEEEAAITAIRRTGRFVDGYYPEIELRKLLVKHFGDLQSLHKFGLVKHFKDLQSEVEEKKLIGLILLGTDVNFIPDDMALINKYETIHGQLIRLTISSITQRLITDYIKKENVKKLCMETPNFEIYYKKDSKRTNSM